MGGALTFRSLESFERCPYAYRLDLTEANRRREPMEFMDSAVRGAVASLNRGRLRGIAVDRDKAKAVFWNVWDIQSETNPMPPGADRAGLLRTGERCMSNFVRFVSSFGNTEIVACDLHGKLAVPGGSVGIGIDEVSMRGNAMVLTKYVTEPGIRTKEDFENDLEVFAAAQWARYNLPGAGRCILQWRLLYPYIEVEADLHVPRMESAVREVGRKVSTVKACRDFRQRETEFCGQCQYRPVCPRFMHGDTGEQCGRDLVVQYAELQEKIDALKHRAEILEVRRDEAGRRLIDYADAHGYTAVTGGGYKATVSHLKKAELPGDKDELVRRLAGIGKLQEVSMVNYSRLRSDIVKGIADPRIAELAVVLDVDKVTLKKVRRRSLR